MEKLKPIVFVKSSSDYRWTRKNVFQQNLLLKVLPYTDDLDVLKKTVGMKSKAEVLRTLDKLSIRKEFHEALVRNNLAIDDVVSGMKKLEIESTDDKVKLNIYQTILKSIGLDKYEIADGGDGNWEEIMLKIVQEENKNGLVSPLLEQIQYDVKVPEIPEGEKEKREENIKIEKSIYE